MQMDKQEYFQTDGRWAKILRTELTVWDGWHFFQYIFL